MRDEDGNQRLLLAESDSPESVHAYGMHMIDKKQKTYVQLTATDRGDPVLQFFDTATHRRIALGLQGDKARFVCGQDDADRLNVEVRSDNSSIFEMRDIKNNIVRLPK